MFDDAADESVQQTGSRTPAIFVQNESGRLVSFDHDRIPKGKSEKPDDMAKISPRLAALLANDPDIAAGLSIGSDHLPQRDYAAIFRKELQEAADLRSELSILRKVGSRYLFEILAHDVKRDISLGESKLRQTQLAEAAVAVGLEVSKRELERRYGAASDNFDLAVMGLGKLGGGGVDFDSDLDLVMVYEPSAATGHSPDDPKPGELAQRIVEIFVNVLSSMTRDGSLYRVDLRLRPHGKDGQLAISLNAFSEYMLSASSVWELLAFVKLRSVSGNADLANRTEKDICSIIHKKGREMDPHELAAETRRIRLNLQEQR